MRTDYLKLVLPDDGSSSNWSEAINTNFRKIEEAIQDIRSNMVNEVKSIKFDQQTIDYRVSGIIYLNSGTKSGSVQMIVNQTSITAQVALDVSVCQIVGSASDATVIPLLIGYDAETTISTENGNSIIEVMITIDESAELNTNDLVVYVSAAYSPQ